MKVLRDVPNRDWLDAIYFATLQSLLDFMNLPKKIHKDINKFYNRLYRNIDLLIFSDNYCNFDF